MIPIFDNPWFRIRRCTSIKIFAVRGFLDFKKNKSSKAKMSNESTIETFLRIRPSNQKSGYFQVDDIDSNRFNFRLPLNSEHDVVNNTRTHYTFQFNGILNENCNQDDVFRCVGAPAAQSVLEGFNATIFAYGQTGSGKTFTITGGPERYIDRGIIPRSISYLFNEFQAQNQCDKKSFNCYVSYLEIYNESGFDLLNKHMDGDSLRSEIPKVVMLEDENGQLHFRNLSVHKVQSEEDALNLLFIGDTNRAIGETAMNQASSRSHCIFTMMIECRKENSDTLVRSKLNLVDLAGSERVHKTFSAGQTLKEAQFINQSLFFLEMVIVALHEKSLKGDSVHIPYRNSLMTAVLRDSLGGNCKTIMIATISPEKDQTDESISTCQFAQRVALVKNQAFINEAIQPEFVIQRLKQEIIRLREEICLLKASGDDDDNGEVMTTERRENIEKYICEYIENDDDARLNLGQVSLLSIHTAFSIFKRLLKDCKSLSGLSSDVEIGSNIQMTSITHNADLQSQISSLTRTLKQRDKEIEILVDMIKKGQCTAKETVTYSEEKPSSFQESKNIFDLCDPVILTDAAAAFSWFCNQHPGEEKIQEDKVTLKKYIAEAKSSGEKLKKTKDIIKQHTSAIERLRLEAAINQVYEGEGFIDESHPDEEMHRRVIENEKKIYTETIDRIKYLKTMIENVQGSLERGRTLMQANFDIWYDKTCRRLAILESNSLEAKVDTPNEIFVMDQQSDEVQLPPGVVLTGDKETDEDIIAFYRAKNALLGRSKISNAAQQFA